MDLGINVVNGSYDMTLKSTTVSGAAALAQKAIMVFLTNISDYMRTYEGTEFPGYTKGGNLGSVDRMSGLLNIAASTTKDILKEESDIQNITIENISIDGVNISFRILVELTSGLVAETITLGANNG